MEPRPEEKLTPPERTAFRVARGVAANVLKRRLRVLYLARDAYEKLAGKDRALSSVQDDLRLLLRLARAWATLQYRHIPWKSLLYAVAAIVYFVNPVDLIPDVLAGLGFLDDIAVITAVVGSIRGDLEAFSQWEQQHHLPGPEQRMEP